MKPTMKRDRSLTIHKDGTVSVWDCVGHQWRRQPAKQFTSTLLATLTQEERNRILRAASK